MTKTPRRKRSPTYISQGSLCYDSIELLISLTSIRSKKQIRALESHLVQGFTIRAVSEMFGVTNSNLRRDIQKLNKVAGVVNELRKYEYGDQGTQPEQ